MTFENRSDVTEFIEELEKEIGPLSNDLEVIERFYLEEDPVPIIIGHKVVFTCANEVHIESKKMTGFCCPLMIRFILDVNTKKFKIDTMILEHHTQWQALPKTVNGIPSYLSNYLYLISMLLVQLQGKRKFEGC